MPRRRCRADDGRRSDSGKRRLGGDRDLAGAHRGARSPRRGRPARSCAGAGSGADAGSGGRSRGRGRVGREAGNQAGERVGDMRAGNERQGAGEVRGPGEAGVRMATFPAGADVRVIRGGERGRVEEPAAHPAARLGRRLVRPHERRAGAHQQRLDGRRSRLEDGCDLVLREAAPVAQHECLMLGLGKCPEHPAHLGELGSLVARRLTRLGRQGRLVDGHLAPVARQVVRPVLHRREQPGARAHELASRLEVAVRLQERLLDDVLRVGAAPGEVKRISERLGGVFLVQLREHAARVRANGRF